MGNAKNGSLNFRQPRPVQAAEAYAQLWLGAYRQPALLLNRHLRIEAANAAFCNLVKMPAAEIANVPLNQLQHGYWYHPGLPQWVNTVGSEPAYSYTIGSEASLFSCLASTLQFPDLSDTHILLVFTPSMAASVVGSRQALAESLFENSPDCLKIMDLNGVVVLLNEAGRELLEFDNAAQMQGMCWINLWAVEHQEAARLAIEQASRGGTGRFTAFGATSKGTPKWWDVVVTPLRNEEGVVVQLVSSCRDITARVNMQRKIEEDEQRLRLALEVAQLGVWEHDPHSEEVWANRRLLEFCDAVTNKQPEAPLLIATPHSEEYRRMCGVIAEASENAVSGASVEHRFVTADGKSKWLRIISKSVFDPAGKLVRRLGVAQDITAQEEARLQLQQSEGRYRAIFNEAPVSIWEEDFSEIIAGINALKAKGVVDFEQYLTDNPDDMQRLLQAMIIRNINEASMHMFGARSKEELLTNLGNVILPGVYPVFIKELAALAKGEPRFEAEVQLQTLQGKKIWTILNINFPQTNDYSTVLLTLTDITERKNLEEEVQAYALRIRQILESLPQMAWTTSPQGVIDFQSQKWHEYAGQEYMAGGNWNKIIHPDELENYLLLWKEAVAAASGFSAEVRLRRHDGVYCWHLVRADALCDSNGALVLWAGTCTDIHTRKTASEMLEQKVAERTRALTEANSALERSNKELEEFAYVASHDLQEPLRKIRTFADRLLQASGGALPGSMQSNAEKITHAANRMTKLIHGLLDYSRLHASPRVEAVDLHEVVGQVLADYDLQIEQLQAKVAVQALPVVPAVARQMTQLFQNLVDNALKFSRQGVPVEISISTEPLSHADAWRVPLSALGATFQKISVRDNGIGFQADYAERIFNMFQRLHSRSEFEGTGIGLAVCRKIVGNMGGAIWAEAVEGSGAVFHLALPLFEAEEK